MSVRFDSRGIALNSGFVDAYVTNAENIYVGKQQQYVVEGTGMARFAYLDEPKVKPAENEIIIRDLRNGWVVTPDYRGRMSYHKLDQAPIKVYYIGPINPDFTLIVPPSKYHTWNRAINNWELTPANAERENYDKESAKRSLAMSEFDEANETYKFLRAKKDRGRATPEDLKLMVIVEDYMFDLDDYIKGYTNKFPERPEEMGKK